MKRCCRCHEEKPRSEFGRDRRSVDGLSYRCLTCNRAKVQRYRAENAGRLRRTRGPEFDAVRAYQRDYQERWRKTPKGRANRRREVLRKYGMTPEEFDELLAQQGGGCAICGSTVVDGRERAFHVDHQHGSGAVRGLLCGPCNQGLGLFADNPDRLVAAAAYLITHSEEEPGHLVALAGP